MTYKHFILVFGLTFFLLLFGSNLWILPLIFVFFKEAFKELKFGHFNGVNIIYSALGTTLGVVIYSILKFLTTILK